MSRHTSSQSEQVQNTTIPSYYDSRKTKIKVIFNGICIAMMTIASLGIANECNAFGGSQDVDQVDKADIGFYSVLGGTWLTICAIGNIAFCQRDKIAPPFEYKRTCYTWFCPARLEQPVDVKYIAPIPGMGTDTTPCWLKPFSC